MFTEVNASGVSNLVEWVSDRSITNATNRNSCATSTRKLYGSEDNVVIAGKAWGVYEYRTVLAKTLHPGAATSHR